MVDGDVADGAMDDGGGADDGVDACANWNAALATVSARAADNGLASIVALINAATANERTSGAGRISAWGMDAMLGSSSG
jgi:hypothetical protein